MKLTKFKYFKLNKKDNQDLQKEYNYNYITFSFCRWEIGTGQFYLNILNYHFYLNFRHNKKTGKAKTYIKF